MKKNKGFTLAELIASILIIAVISLVAFEYVILCERLIIKPKLRLIAVNFARYTMEELYRLDYNSPDLAVTSGDPETGTGGTEKSLPSEGDIGLLAGYPYNGTRKYWVQEFTSASGTSFYKVITVKVNWNDR